MNITWRPSLRSWRTSNAVFNLMNLEQLENILTDRPIAKHNKTKETQLYQNPGNKEPSEEHSQIGMCIRQDGVNVTNLESAAKKVSVKMNLIHSSNDHKESSNVHGIQFLVLLHTPINTQLSIPLPSLTPHPTPPCNPFSTLFPPTIPPQNSVSFHVCLIHQNGKQFGTMGFSNTRYTICSHTSIIVVWDYFWGALLVG